MGTRFTRNTWLWTHNSLSCEKYHTNPNVSVECMCLKGNKNVSNIFILIETKKSMEKKDVNTYRDRWRQTKPFTHRLPLLLWFLYKKRIKIKRGYLMSKVKYSHNCAKMGDVKMIDLGRRSQSWIRLTSVVIWCSEWPSYYCMLCCLCWRSQ